MKYSFLQFLKERQALTEAQFSGDKVAKVLSLYGILFGKKLGGTFYYFTSEKVNKRGDKFVGYRLMNSDGYQLRFNFEKGSVSNFSKNVSKNEVICKSIDYWEPGAPFDLPTLTCNFAPNVNVKQIYDKLCKLLKSGKTGKFSYEDLGADLTEAIGSKEYVDFLSSRGMKRSLGYKGGKVFKQAIHDAGLEKEWEEYVLEITKGKPESNSTQAEFDNTQKELDDHVYANPKTVFKDIEALVTMAGTKSIKSLIICGLGGIGKTYHVTKALKEMFGPSGSYWHYHSGAKISARSMYTTIFDERKEVVVFDEADSILTNNDCIMMLKPALDTSGDNTFEYLTGTYNVSKLPKDELETYCDQCDAVRRNGGELRFSTKQPASDETKYMPYPSKFYFTGSLIMISNMRASKIDQAIMSRSLFVDVYLCATDIRNRIEDILKAQGYPEKDINEVLDALSGKADNSDATGPTPGVTYMSAAIARQNKPLTVRSAVVALKMKQQGIPNWQRMAGMYA